MEWLAPGAPLEVEAARLRPAEAMLSVATEESADVEVLRTGAPQAMAMDYRSGFGSRLKTQAEGSA